MGVLFLSVVINIIVTVFILRAYSNSLKEKLNNFIFTMELKEGEQHEFSTVSWKIDKGR